MHIESEDEIIPLGMTNNHHNSNIKASIIIKALENKTVEGEGEGLK